MPTFDTLPLSEARANSATGQRAALLQEYMGYIQRVAPGKAGKLQPEAGETTQALRRRLTAAAEALGKELQVRRSANAVYFWMHRRPRAAAGPARTRPRSPRFSAYTNAESEHWLSGQQSRLQCAGLLLLLLSPA